MVSDAPNLASLLRVGRPRSSDVSSVAAPTQGDLRDPSVGPERVEDRRREEHKVLKVCAEGRVEGEVGGEHTHSKKVESTPVVSNQIPGGIRSHQSKFCT